ncbi:MAG: hypothetical protein F4X54_07140 [Chloroflexi bacterium]|nr:hypothetical protein [Chloroflexota bacterium]
MTVQRERFSSRVDSELLAALCEVARREGRPFNAVLEDVMRDYIAARKSHSADLDVWWPPHPTARLAEGLSLRREDMYEDRVQFPGRTDSEPASC